uniref:Uncharacterized protein n=1 Tax=Arundo donax TaxID=35708 RepID=A0A0A8YXY7_ARUDO
MGREATDWRKPGSTRARARRRRSKRDMEGRRSGDDAAVVAT